MMAEFRYARRWRRMHTSTCDSVELTFSSDGNSPIRFENVCLAIWNYFPPLSSRERTSSQEALPEEPKRSYDEAKRIPVTPALYVGLLSFSHDRACRRGLPRKGPGGPYIAFRPGTPDPDIRVLIFAFSHDGVARDWKIRQEDAPESICHAASERVQTGSPWSNKHRI